MYIFISLSSSYYLESFMVMEFHNQSPLFFYFISSFLFLFMLFKLVHRSNSNTTTKLPPGPRTLPIIGNIHQLFGSQTHHCFKKLADEYGPLMHLKLGEVSNIIVSSKEMAEEIMKTHDLNFSDRPMFILSSRIVDLMMVLAFPLLRMEIIGDNYEKCAL